MAKSNVLKMTAPAKKVPQTAAEASGALADLGLAMAERQRLEGKMNAEIAEITARYTEKVRPHKEKEEALFEGLQAWAEANRKDVCKGDSKTVQLGTGEVGWRTNPEKVSLKNEDMVIEILEAKGLEDFVRVKKSVDKTMVLKNQDQVAGIKGLAVVQTETFRAKPANVEMEKLAS